MPAALPFCYAIKAFLWCRADDEVRHQRGMAGTHQAAAGSAVTDVTILSFMDFF